MVIGFYGSRKVKVTALFVVNAWIASVRQHWLAFADSARQEPGGEDRDVVIARPSGLQKGQSLVTSRVKSAQGLDAGGTRLRSRTTAVRVCLDLFLESHIGLRFARKQGDLLA